MTRRAHLADCNGGVEVEPTYGLARNILKPWLATWFRWNIEGIENIPRRGGALIAFNHIAYLDPLAAAYVIDKAGRIPRFLAKQELFDDRKIGWVLKGAKQIPVHRGTADAPMALDAAFDALERGELIVIFPEGTITDDPDLNPMRGKTGISRLALQSGAPVIPCGLWGTANIWPKGYAKRWRPRQDICVRVGEPLTFRGDASSRSEWERVAAEVMERIAVLVASVRPAVPDRRRAGKRAA
ncbi:MAG: 1-acyl-sn-glycerol-3-phosphate acyltransferase [Actinomycetota bacterium]|nr:1-acyl-sn-glycerol-3-phosphate acyltransferase [Actinomycetota bacterium]